MSAPTAANLRQHYLQVLKLQPACSSEEIAARLAVSTPEELLELDRRLQDAGVDAFLAGADLDPGFVDLDDEPMQFDEARAGRGAPYLRQMLRRADVPEDRWIRHDDDEAGQYPGLPDDESAEGATEHHDGELSAARVRLLNALVASLPGFEREVVTLLAFEELSPEETSHVLGVSRVRVSLAFQSAMAKIQRGLLEARTVTATRIPEVLRHALKLS
jgi:RNA polymerase sigma factor (sigma-70 family)